MKLQTFLDKNNIKLPQISKRLCLKGIQIMKQGIDSFHDEKHVEELLENLNYLLNKSKGVKSKINFEILLTSICWHDVWSSKQKVSTIFELLRNQVMEGMGSAYMFHKYAKEIGIDRKLAKQITYVIRKHSSFQIIPAYTFEAKILIDLDKIEMWNRYRFLRKGDNLLVGELKFFNKFWVRHYYAFIAWKGMYFKNLEKLVKKKTKLFSKLIREQLTQT